MTTAKTIGLVALGLTCISLGAVGDAAAQAYPNRPARIVVPFPAGGPVDNVARSLGAELAKTMGQQFVVDNRAGGNTIIGSDAMVRSPPDGYTILLTTLPNAVNATLYTNLNFNFIRDIAPVAGEGRVG